MGCWRWPAATGRLTEQIKSLRRTIATDMGFVLPPVRIRTTCGWDRRNT